MTDILKRNRSESNTDLVTALEDFIELLKSEEEDDAAHDLHASLDILIDAKPGSEEQINAAQAILECFDGDHELNVYTLHKQTEEWTKADQLSNVSTRVLSLTKRILNAQK